ncbi:MAG: phosphoribosyltransferase family protein [Bacillota bacterium]|nr:phosphoribosyltransferase family protein [Bacillota bacterium]
MDNYRLELAGVTRWLPKIRISDKLTIASFVILGDCELVRHAAPELDRLLPDYDCLVTAEAKGITLVYELSRIRNIDRFIVARKSTKAYMADPLGTSLQSITTHEPQNLYLDGHEAAAIRGRRIAIVDDVISTGESLAALEQLVTLAGAKVVAKAALLAEGAAAERDDIIFLQKLPLFGPDGEELG